MTTITATNASPGKATALGGQVLRGSFWMVFNSVVTRIASLLAIVFLGKWLSDHDFGVYGLAMSISALAGVLRDGGVRQILLQRQGEYANLIGPIFWMAFAFNTATGIILAGLAPVLAHAYNEPETMKLLLIIAAAQVMSTPGVIMQSRLMIELRFRDVSMIQAVSGTIRFCGSILLAWIGLGPLSFVLPLPACALLEWAWSWVLTRETLWGRRAEVKRWGGFFALSVWTLLGTFGIALINWGTNPAIKFLGISTDIVGVYFFAYQIVVQVGILISSNVNQVLFSVMAKIAGDTERLAQAALRSLHQVMLLGAALSVGLAVTFAPLESLIWTGHKAAAVVPVLWLGAMYPLSVALVVPLSVQQARGRFRSWAVGLILTACVSLTTAIVGAKLTGSASGVAAWNSIGTSAATLVYALAILRGLGVGIGRILGAALPAWILAVIAGVGGWEADRLLAAQHPLVRFLACGTSFTLLFVVLVRVLLVSHVRDTVGVLPGRLRFLATRVLVLPGGTP